MSRLLPEAGTAVFDDDPPFIPDPRRTVAVRHQTAFLSGVTVNQSSWTTSTIPYQLNILALGFGSNSRTSTTYRTLNLNLRLQFSLGTATTATNCRMFLLYDRTPYENLTPPPFVPHLPNLYYSDPGYPLCVTSQIWFDGQERFLIFYDKTFTLGSAKELFFLSEQVDLDPSFVTQFAAGSSTHIVRGRFYVGFLPDVEPSNTFEVNGTIAASYIMS